MVVIGAGPGGYVCAIRAAQLGLTVALVEKQSTLGGTCLNVGCIPSKALLHSTEMYAFARHHAADHGFKFDGLATDIAALMKKKQAVVDRLVGGVQQLVSRRKIKIFHGMASFAQAGELLVKDSKGGEISLRGRHTVIATGSRVASLPALPFDGETVVSSDEAIAFDEVPPRIVVVGAGAIGLELGSVWSRLGSKVSVVEFLPRIAAGYDDDVCKLLERTLKKQGIEFYTDTKVTGIKKGGKKKPAIVEADKDGKSITLEADKVLVAVGRRPNTEGLGLENAGVQTDEKGRIEVDDHFRTAVSGIYAIGDVIHGPMLAHKAEEEGVALAEMLAGKAGHVNYDVIPNVIYTDPEVASAGLTERLAKEKGVSYRVGSFPFAANGRAIAVDATDGFVKIIAEEKTDRVLGIQIVCRGASELIAAAVTHMEYGGSAEDIARTVHAHPTLSEALKEAALAVDKRALHSL